VCSYQHETQREQRTVTTLEALGALRACRHQIIGARREADLAINAGLAGARHTRAVELADKLADCQCFVERLAFLVEGDWRAGL
jgi:hypothetical protein